MTYQLNDSIAVVKGIGDKLRRILKESGINTVLDLLLYLPYRYEDRSQIITIDQLKVGEQATIKAKVLRANLQYRGRQTITRATVQDATGQVPAIWFNNRFVMNQLKQGAELYFAGTFNDRRMLLQPTVEKVSDDTIHTARLVPFYTQLDESLKIGSLRRILKELTDNLEPVVDPLSLAIKEKYPDFISALQTLHFPSREELIPAARERLALEELLGLIQHSQTIKNQWQNQHRAHLIKLANYDSKHFKNWLPKSIPFELTTAQQRATQEILADLRQPVAMNRLLTGDVGSGKTVVAGLACHFVLQNGYHAALAAPTQILAQQHLATFQQLFPHLNSQLLTSNEAKQFKPSKQPTLYIGTHAVINRLEAIQPGLIIYDEQHRFGVKQRTTPAEGQLTPHILTMSATPIPRTLMLTLFSHLSLSVIDELPAGRKPVTTWLVPQSKRESSLNWLGKTLLETQGQALVVCPFIEPSSLETFGNVAAANKTFETLKTYYQTHFPKLKLGLLHGKLKPTEKQQVIEQLFERQINLLVTTPVVEVGVDLPAANLMIIEAAERFGLASLHQLRGRIGRAGQESFCLLFSNFSGGPALQRLKKFTHEHNGLKLAEQDLQTRGAGDLFGFRQHGFNDLKFASWANLELIQDAHLAFQKLSQKKTWQPLLVYRPNDLADLPAAN